jgi:lysophospholipase L1-like esterase
MIVPDIHDLSQNSPYKELYNRMETAFSAAGLETLNAYPAFQERFGDREQDLWIQGDDPHPNAQGHALMADLVYRYMVDRNPLGLTRAR